MVYGYKKVRVVSKKTNRQIKVGGTPVQAIIKVFIPGDAIVFCRTTNNDDQKTRADRAIFDSVVGFVTRTNRGLIKYHECSFSFRTDRHKYVALRNTEYEYVLGKVQLPNYFDSSNLMCSHGIHYFPNKHTAIQYNDF